MAFCNLPVVYFEANILHTYAQIQDKYPAVIPVKGLLKMNHSRHLCQEMQVLKDIIQ